MGSNNWINYLAMNSIKLLGDREWDYLDRISNRLEELGWINDFPCLRKGIDECGEEAETKYDDEDMAWLGISTDIIIFSESVVWNIHRYPSHSATALSVTIRKEILLPTRKQSVEKKAKPWMTWFLSLHRLILSLGLMKNLIKQKIFSTVPWLHLKASTCCELLKRTVVVVVDAGDTKKLWSASGALSRCSTETLHQWKKERWTRQKVLMEELCCDNLGFTLRLRQWRDRGECEMLTRFKFF